jgi:hypothetical protein
MGFFPIVFNLNPDTTDPRPIGPTPVEMKMNLYESGSEDGGNKASDPRLQGGTPCGTLYPWVHSGMNWWRWWE